MSEPENKEELKDKALGDASGAALEAVSASKKTSKKKVVIPLVIIGLLLGAGIVWFIIMENTEAPVEEESAKRNYESNIILSEDDLDAEKVASGDMDLKFKQSAVSNDGKTFGCYICNSEANSYDMYIEITLNDGTEVYTSGLFPIGGRIETFTSAKELSPGDYDATLRFVQVEDDGVTEHAYVNVGYTLSVVGN